MMRNPIFESSMKRRMRSYRAPLLITLYVAFLLLVSAGALAILLRDQVSLGNLRMGLETYIYVSVMQFALIVLVAPALCSGAISGERERQTLDLLLCTRVGGMRIALGKMLSNLCFLALMVVSSLPITAITLFFGGISIVDMLTMQLFLLVTATACCSIGLFCSAIFKRTVTATVVAYLAIFAIGFGTIIIPAIFQSDRMASLSELIYSISPNYSSSTFYGGTMVDAAEDAAKMLPALFYVNPAISLLSLLVHQTGLLRNTMSTLVGGMGDQLYLIINLIGPVAWINMGIMAVVSVVLMVLSGLFIKPSGRKVRKHK